jgi:phosphoadenosine phosphosulfate reductase
MPLTTTPVAPPAPRSASGPELDAFVAELADWNRGLLALDPIDAAHAAVAGADARWGAPVDDDSLRPVVFTCSFEDAALAHVVSVTAPRTEIVLLDTQYLFAETRWFIERLTARLGQPVTVVTPAADVVPDDRWLTDTEGCCQVRKVEPLQRTLAGRTAWITGVRRADGPTRAEAPIVSWDPTRSVVKLNPLATWSDELLAEYLATNELPIHPLVDKGYASIGCWPCTRPVAPGEDKRAGRWSGQAKTECGLHR